MKYITVISIGLVILLFMGWYFPVSYMNVFSCDDFWFGTNVHNNGFWGNQLFYWENWEGSYTHTFLASLPHAFGWSKMPFFSNLFSITCFFLSLLLLIRTFTKNNIKTSVLSSIFVLSFVFLFTNGICEIRFWVCANITYITECSIVLSSLSYYHRVNCNPSKKNIFIMFGIIFLLGGCKIDFIAYGIGGLLFYDIIHKNGLNKMTIAVYLTLCVFCCVNVFAPGNYIRLAEETRQRVGEEQMTIAEILLFRACKIVKYLICSVLLFPIIPQLKMKFVVKKSQLLLGGVFISVMFIVDSFLMYLCFNDPGPNRVYICAELSIVLFMVPVLYYAYHKWQEKDFLVKTLVLCGTIILIVSNILIYPQVLPSIEYAVKSAQRDSFVRKAKDNTMLELDALPDSYLLLSYFSNAEFWLENIYFPYFNKHCKVIILKNDTEE